MYVVFQLGHACQGAVSSSLSGCEYMCLPDVACMVIDIILVVSGLSIAATLR